jgi:cytidine deaminase
MGSTFKLAPSVRAGLEREARAASRAAYAPYSKFRVGASVLGGSGKIYRGCNVENAAYGMCTCAERTAILTAIAAGEKRLHAVAVYTPTPTPTSPCGGCRQVISEFGPDALVISICDSNKRIESSLSQLLPERFGPKDLFRKSRK